MHEITPVPPEDPSNLDIEKCKDDISIRSSGETLPEDSSSYLEKGDIEVYPEAEPATRTETNIAKRILSRISTKSSWIDPGPPPDGGFKAWLQCAMGCLIVVTTWCVIQPMQRTTEN
jgi:hypothetical protein